MFEHEDEVMEDDLSEPGGGRANAVMALLEAGERGSEESANEARRMLCEHELRD